VFELLKLLNDQVDEGDKVCWRGDIEQAGVGELLRLEGCESDQGDDLDPEPTSKVRSWSRNLFDCETSILTRTVLNHLILVRILEL
jgi:hypothetical protein